MRRGPERGRHGEGADAVVQTYGTTGCCGAAAVEEVSVAVLVVQQ